MDGHFAAGLGGGSRRTLLGGRSAGSSSRRPLRAVACALVAVGTGAPVAWAAEARVPDPPPPTQVSRDLTLTDAARRGVVKLRAKGVISGDGVSVRVDGRRIKGPITVTAHVEFFPPSDRQDPAALRNVMPQVQQAVTNKLNRVSYRTSKGDAVRFAVDFQVRGRGDAPTPGYHQIELIDPARLSPPNPHYRSNADHAGTPNSSDPAAVVHGHFAIDDVSRVWPHEILHVMGLDDRYQDVYQVGGRRYPLPDRGLDNDPAALAAWARSHAPPLAPPPAGRVRSVNTPHTGACDIMGTGLRSDCGRVSPRDINFLAAQAGVQVTAEPGDIMLDKNSAGQTYGVGFRTIVFAPPGRSTTAEGISVYCIDGHKNVPSQETFDVLGPARNVPGMERLATLLALSGRRQTSLTFPPPGMLAAVWMVTDGRRLADGVLFETNASEDQARALLTEAGVPEEAAPGLPHLTTVNAGSPDTGSVTTTGVEPAIPPGPQAAPPAARLSWGTLYPNVIKARRRQRAELVLSVGGAGMTVRLTVERRVRGHWRRVGSLRQRRVRVPGEDVSSVHVPKLGPGHHRIVATPTTGGPPVLIPFDVRASTRHR
jgi:hypothetical protein